VDSGTDMLLPVSVLSAWCITFINGISRRAALATWALGRPFGPPPGTAVEGLCLERSILFLVGIQGLVYGRQVLDH
jgi:hypothetical protein